MQTAIKIRPIQIRPLFSMWIGRLLLAMLVAHMGMLIPTIVFAQDETVDLQVSEPIAQTGQSNLSPLPATPSVQSRLYVRERGGVPAMSSDSSEIRPPVQATIRPGNQSNPTTVGERPVVQNRTSARVPGGRVIVRERR